MQRLGRTCCSGKQRFPLAQCSVRRGNKKGMQRRLCNCTTTHSRIERRSEKQKHVTRRPGLSHPRHTTQGPSSRSLSNMMHQPARRAAPRPGCALEHACPGASGRAARRAAYARNAGNEPIEDQCACHGNGLQEKAEQRQKRAGQAGGRHTARLVRQGLTPARAPPHAPRAARSTHRAKQDAPCCRNRTRGGRRGIAEGMSKAGGGRGGGPGHRNGAERRGTRAIPAARSGTPPPSCPPCHTRKLPDIGRHGRVKGAVYNEQIRKQVGGGPKQHKRRGRDGRCGATTALQAQQPCRRNSARALPAISTSSDTGTVHPTMEGA